MTQYNTLNVKLSNPRLNKLKSGIKYGTEVALEVSSNVVGGFNNKNNGSSVNIKLSKTHLRKIGQSGGILSRILGPLLKTGLSLIGIVLKPLAKSVLIPLELIAAASATDAAVHKTMFRSGFTTLIISNEEMNHIRKTAKALEGSGLLIKGVSGTIKNEAKKTKRRVSLNVIRHFSCYFIR